MKLVTFSVAGPLGAQRRLRTTAYATCLARHTDAPTPREVAASV